MVGESLTYRLATPRGVAGAIAAIELVGASGAALERGPVAMPALGCWALTDLVGVDRGVVARWDETRATVFPHGGVLVTRRLCAALADAGVEERPAARRDLDCLVSEAMARAASRVAVDLLADQPRRWRAAGLDPFGDLPAGAVADPAALRRLIDPPVVAAVGRPNIGKSSLANVLAGRSVAVVHDAPGVTRDAVGVELELDGLVVRWLDTPGIEASEPEDGVGREARRRGLAAAAMADLVLSCGDPGTPAVEIEARDSMAVCLRSDLGAVPARVLGVCARTGAGVPELAAAVRARLAPDEALSDPRPVRFWDR